MNAFEGHHDFISLLLAFFIHSDLTPQLRMNATYLTDGKQMS